MITLTAPVVRSFTKKIVTEEPAETTYTGLWLSEIIIGSPSPLEPTTVFVKMRPFDPTTGELHPDDNMQRNLRIADLFELAATNPAVAASSQSLIDTIGALAVAAGLNNYAP